MATIAARADAFMTKHFTRHSITWRQAMVIILPLIAENLTNNLFGTLNTGMISSSGEASLSAVSLVDTLNTFLFVFYTGIATGASVIVANYRGMGNPEKLHKACTQAVTAVVLFTLFTTVFIILFHVPLLKLLFGAAEQEIVDKARFYMLGGAISLPLLGITTAFCGVLRGIGEGKTALLYTVTSLLIYLGLNLVFLTGLKLGITGLLLSILLNRILNIPLLFGLLWIRKSAFRYKVKEFFHLDTSMLRRIMRVGIPCAVEQMFFVGGRVVTQSMLVALGTGAIVVYNISYSILTLNEALVTPVNTAMYTVAGMCIGDDRPEDVRDLTKSYLGLNTVLYWISLGLIMLLFKPLTIFYSASAENIPRIFQLVLITGIAHPLIHSLGFTLPTVFRATGDGIYTTVARLLVMWGLRIVGAYILGFVFGLGVLGVWCAMILDWLVRAGIFSIRFRGNKWLKHKKMTE